jgi:hypothetical protein
LWDLLEDSVTGNWKVGRKIVEKSSNLNLIEVLKKLSVKIKKLSRWKLLKVFKCLKLLSKVNFQSFFSKLFQSSTTQSM